MKPFTYYCGQIATLLKQREKQILRFMESGELHSLGMPEETAAFHRNPDTVPRATFFRREGNLRRKKGPRNAPFLNLRGRIEDVGHYFGKINRMGGRRTSF
jgi:hypothetical protein